VGPVPDLPHTVPYVVVGVDGSAASVQALAWALRWAEGSRHRVVATLVLPRTYGHIAGFDDVSAAEPVSRDDGAAMLARAVTRTCRRVGGNATVLQRVHAGDVAEQLLHEARHASLLVLGRSNSRLAGRLLGPVPAVLRRARCPVVVVPPDAALPPAAVEPLATPTALLATA